MDLVHECITFIDKSPTEFHFISNAIKFLKKSKFEYFGEEETKTPNKLFFFHDDALIACKVGDPKKIIVFTSNCQNKKINVKIDFNQTKNNDNLLFKKLDANPSFDIWKSRILKVAGRIKIGKKEKLFDFNESFKINDNCQNNDEFSFDSSKSYIWKKMMNFDDINFIHNSSFYLVDNEDAHFIGCQKSILNYHDLSTTGISYLGLKAFALSTPKDNSTIYYIISSNNRNKITSNFIEIHSKIHKINYSLSQGNNQIQALVISAQGNSGPDLVLSKGIEIYHNNKKMIEKIRLLAKKQGIPFRVKENLETTNANNSILRYISEDFIQNNSLNVITLLLPLLNNGLIRETGAVSDIIYLYNMIIEILSNNNIFLD